MALSSQSFFQWRAAISNMEEQNVIRVLKCYDKFGHYRRCVKRSAAESVNAFQIAELAECLPPVRRRDIAI